MFVHVNILPVQKYLNKQLLEKIKDRAGGVIRRYMIRGRSVGCCCPVLLVLLITVGRAEVGEGEVERDKAWGLGRGKTNGFTHRGDPALPSLPTPQEEAPNYMCHFLGRSYHQTLWRVWNRKTWWIHVNG